MTERRSPSDHFSSVSAGYAVFRPRYPRTLFEFVASIAPRHDRAWDCGAGTGQATIDLADYFDEVIATDVSAEQIARAPEHPRIEWLVAPAEQVPLRDASVDLVTVAQALHWFDHERFYAEARRVAAAGAAIAAWTYVAPRMEGDVGATLHRFMFDDVGTYWPPERRYVDEEYRTIPFPFERIDAPPITLENDWTVDQVIGYLRTMSATARCIAATGVDPVADVADELRVSWGAVPRRRITWPVVVLAGRVA